MSGISNMWRGLLANSRFLRIASDAIERFLSDRCMMLASGIAFNSAFSLAPTLLIVLAVAGWFLGADAAQGKLFAEVKNVLGNEAAAAMQDIVTHAHRASGGGIAAAASVILLIVGASATFSSLNTALDTVFDAKPRAGVSGFAVLLRVRLLSIALVLGIGFLLVVSLVLDTAIQIAAHAVFGSTPLIVAAVIGQAIVGLLALSVAFAALIKWLPDAPVRFADAVIGAFVSALLFTIGRQLFGFYLAHTGTVTTFGAAGSLAVLMMWLYFSSLVFLLGAEVTAAIRASKERQHVSRRSSAAVR
jgi:membrane protein